MTSRRGWVELRWMGEADERRRGDSATVWAVILAIILVVALLVLYEKNDSGKIDRMERELRGTDHKP